MRVSRPTIASTLIVIFSLVLTYSTVIDFLIYRNKGRPPYLGGTDTNLYFAWGRSLVFDGDIDFRNELDFIKSRNVSKGLQIASASMEEVGIFGPTQTGMVANKYGIGTGLLAVPSLFLARLVSALYGQVTGIAVSPFASIYPLVFKVNNIAIGLLGVFVMYRSLKRRYGELPSLASAAGILFASSLTYYLWVDAAMAHATGFGITAIILALSLTWRERLQRESQLSLASMGTALILGLLVGIDAAVRYPNIVMGLLPAAIVIEWWYKNKERTTKRLTQVLTLFALGSLGLFVGIAPQLLAWKILYGSWLTRSYQGETVETWPKYALYVLFSPAGGVFSSTPLCLLGFIGLVRGAMKGMVVSIAGLITFLAFLWIYGSWSNYWLGQSFGMRGFIDMYPFFMVGLSYWGSLLHGRGATLLYSGAGALILLNAFLLDAYHERAFRSSRPFELKRFEGIFERITARKTKQIRRMFRPGRLVNPFNSILK